MASSAPTAGSCLNRLVPYEIRYLTVDLTMHIEKGRSVLADFVSAFVNVSPDFFGFFSNYDVNVKLCTYSGVHVFV
jgi:hypothetical protein